VNGPESKTRDVSSSSPGGGTRKNADLFSIYSNNMKYERKNYIKEAKQAPILKNLIDNSEINKRPGGRITCEQCHAGQQG